MIQASALGRNLTLQISRRTRIASHLPLHSKYHFPTSAFEQIANENATLFLSPNTPKKYSNVYVETFSKLVEKLKKTNNKIKIAEKDKAKGFWGKLRSRTPQEECASAKVNLLKGQKRELKATLSALLSRPEDKRLSDAQLDNINITEANKAKKTIKRLDVLVDLATSTGTVGGGVATGLFMGPLAGAGGAIAGGTLSHSLAKTIKKIRLGWF